MEVILLERVAKLGQMGDVVKVRPGYARNFLIPQRKAVRATGENRKRFEEERAQLEATNLSRRSEAEEIAARMKGLSVILIRQAGESGQLYGSVNARDIADSVTDEGVSVARQQVVLPRPIKSLGIHDVSLALHPEVVVDILVNVARSPDEAELQAKSGRAVLGSAYDDEAVDVEDQAREVFEEEAAGQALEEIMAEDVDESAEGDSGDVETNADPDRDVAQPAKE